MTDWLGCLVASLVGAAAGIGMAFYFWRSQAPRIAQGMFDALGQLPLDEAVILFAKQRKTTACAVVLADSQGMLVAIATSPDLTPEQQLDFETKASASLDRYVRFKDEQASKLPH